jgi:hypothetical protein
MRISARVQFDAKTLQPFISANTGRVNLHIKQILNLILWPRLKIHGWTRYGGMTVYNLSKPSGNFTYHHV